LQSAVDYGLTAGLHSLEPSELAIWLDEVQAGNLYVNRGITGAIVRRQPFGGWKRSSVGAGAKAGGPNYLVHLGGWKRAEATEGSAPRGAVATLVKAAGGDEFLQRSAASDQLAWEREFGVAKDVSALGVERDVFRYRPIDVTVRLNEGGAVGDLVRVLAAGMRAGAQMAVSSAVPLSRDLLVELYGYKAYVTVESDAGWLKRVAGGGLATTRVRLIGGGHSELAAAVGGTPDLAIYSDEVTESGRIELLPFLREQAIAITAHRFGNPDHWSEKVL
jgi:RHH-type transcriptional regulator, proline utilization regulon repressor / proline dehydrogenase / delta 1-pyrroline-5-carboxylate dehydrogenase